MYFFVLLCITRRHDTAERHTSAHRTAAAPRPRCKATSYDGTKGARPLRGHSDDHGRLSAATPISQVPYKHRSRCAARVPPRRSETSSYDGIFATVRSNIPNVSVPLIGKACREHLARPPNGPGTPRRQRRRRQLHPAAAASECSEAAARADWSCTEAYPSGRDRLGCSARLLAAAPDGAKSASGA